MAKKKEDVPIVKIRQGRYSDVHVKRSGTRGVGWVVTGKRSYGEAKKRPRR